MARGNETVEGLLALVQEKEPGELYMYMRVQGNREHGSAGINKELFYFIFL